MSKNTATVYVSPDQKFSIDCVKVPGGLLYVSTHHGWHVMNTVFVPLKEAMGEETTSGANHVNPQYVKDFLEGKR